MQCERLCGASHWRRTTASTVSTPPASRPARPDAIQPEALEIIAPFKPPVVSFHFGLPSDDLLAPIRARAVRFFLVRHHVGRGAYWLRGVSMPSSRKGSK